MLIWFSQDPLILPWSSDKVHKSLREKRHNKRFLPSSLQRTKWSCWNQSYWRNSGRTFKWSMQFVIDYQTIFLNKFLTFFNCHVQPLTDNLQFVEGCQCMVEMTNGNTLLDLVKWSDYASNLGTQLVSRCAQFEPFQII